MIIRIPSVSRWGYGLTFDFDVKEVTPDKPTKIWDYANESFNLYYYFIKQLELDTTALDPMGFCGSVISNHGNHYYYVYTHCSRPWEVKNLILSDKEQLHDSSNKAMDCYDRDRSIGMKIEDAELAFGRAVISKRLYSREISREVYSGVVNAEYLKRLYRA